MDDDDPPIFLIGACVSIASQSETCLQQGAVMEPSRHLLVGVGGGGEIFFICLTYYVSFGGIIGLVWQSIVQNRIVDC
jgi:hypothetical protein